MVTLCLDAAGHAFSPQDLVQAEADVRKSPLSLHALQRILNGITRTTMRAPQSGARQQLT